MILVTIVAALLGLAVLQLVWLGPTPLALFLALPLLLAAALQRPGNHQRRLGAAILTLPYFAVGVMEWMVTGGHWALVQVALCLVVGTLLIVGRVRTA